MAEELAKFADVLEKAENFDEALQKLVCDTFTAHQRIIFNGNGYSDEWTKEAEKRGLSNLPSTADALKTYVSDKNIDLVTRHGIYSEAEYLARYEIHLEAYAKIINIEARTTVDMVMQQILPAASRYSAHLAESITTKKGLGVCAGAEESILRSMASVMDKLYESCQKLKKDVACEPGDFEKAVAYCHSVIVTDMNEVRAAADELETLTDKSVWPFPTYSDMLYY